MFEEFAVIKKEMELVYLHDRRPWMIGYSGGKDSTLLCQLVFEMLEGLPEKKRWKPVYIVTSDTMVENPIVKAYMHKMSKAINDASAAKNLNVQAHIIYPEIRQTFWSLVIGLGYPTPEPPGFRWCTERLKINPSNAFTYKNGAGKTTLFTAVQVCLYGNFAFGFKSSGKRYLSEIYSLINSQVRVDEAESAHVEICFQQVDNTDLFNYVIRRSWAWPQNELQETLSVWKNGQLLKNEDLLNFQNYLIHLIPPDMLKLYFFDGEKIADYFLGDKEVNIRDALMVLSGNDTFDILHDQVRRVLKNSEDSQNGIAQAYLTAKAELEECHQQIRALQTELCVFCFSSVD